MNKKILMIGWEYPPHITGGLAIACKGLAKALAKKNHHLYFMVPKLWGDEEANGGIDLFDVCSKKSVLNAKRLREIEMMEPYPGAGTGMPGSYGTHGADPKTAAQLIGEEARTLGKGSALSGGYNERTFWEIERYAVWAGAYAEALDFDVIHCHDWMTFPAGMSAKRASGKPLICHVHATEFDRSGEKVNQRIYDLEREALHFCDKVITVSDYTKRVLVERYAVDPAKIETVHNGIEFEFSMDAIDPANRVQTMQGEKLVLFLGRITFQKGPDYFVMAAKRVIETMQNVRFVMAGTGDMYHRMIEMAADLGIGRHFHYTGFLNKNDADRLYRSSDLYVMPSVSEPFGLSPLEAMMHKIPVIISKQSGVSEVIQNCIKVDFWNVTEIAEAIIQVLKDDTLQNELRYSGHEEAKRVTWDEAANKLEHIYHKLS